MIKSEGKSARLFMHFFSTMILANILYLIFYTFATFAVVGAFDPPRSSCKESIDESRERAKKAQAKLACITKKEESIEALIHRPMVVPYAEPGPSSRGEEASVIEREGQDVYAQPVMEQVCSCDSCTAAVVASYKRLVNEGKVTDFKSFREYWRSRCLCVAQNQC